MIAHTKFPQVLTQAFSLERRILGLGCLSWSSTLQVQPDAAHHPSEASMGFLGTERMSKGRGCVGMKMKLPVADTNKKNQ